MVRGCLVVLLLVGLDKEGGEKICCVTEEVSVSQLRRERRAGEGLGRTEGDEVGDVWVGEKGASGVSCWYTLSWMG